MLKYLVWDGESIQGDAYGRLIFHRGSMIPPSSRPPGVLARAAFDLLHIGKRKSKIVTYGAVVEATLVEERLGVEICALGTQALNNRTKTKTDNEDLCMTFSTLDCLLLFICFTILYSLKCLPKPASARTGPALKASRRHKCCQKAHKMLELAYEVFFME